MPCRIVRTRHGFNAFACGPRPHRRKCTECGAPAGLLCDWKTAPGATCDAPVCELHGEKVGEDKHLCPSHKIAYRLWIEKRKS